MSKETVIIILVVICFVFGLLWEREKNEAKDLEKYFKHCRLHCDELVDCSDWQSSRAQLCWESYVDSQPSDRIE